VKTRARRLARDLVPPVIARAARRGRRREGAHDDWDALGGVEVGPEWYDARFEADGTWREHYSRSPYYHFWTVITDRIAHMKAPAVLEIGCGSGQLAMLLRDRDVDAYVGFDFAPKRLAWARRQVPDYRFEVADAFGTDLYGTAAYNVVVCTEFLEHVERDLDVIDRLRPGTRFIGTVPNFGGGSHVRHFDDEAGVRSRYGAVLSELRIDGFPDRRGHVHFLLDGHTRAGG
jgi:SAM-dependent methyltransferase